MKDLSNEVAELKLEVKCLKNALAIEVNMKNNMNVFIMIHGLMKELLTFDKDYPLEVACSSHIPFLEYSDKVEAEEERLEAEKKQLEKSIS